MSKYDDAIPILRIDLQLPNTLVNTAEVMQGEFIPAPPKQSKTVQKYAAMLERCFRGPDARKEMP
jgi:hypothetical protein